jgi:Lipocalin-like domain
MKTSFKLGFAVIVASVVIAACGKYEEGPKISFASKKGRVANTWKVEAFLQDGVDKTSDYRLVVASESYEMKKDGGYTTTQTYTALGGGLTSTDNGTWELIDDNESLKMLSSQTGATADTMKIIRLKSNEMWLRSVSGTPVSEMHLVTK